MEQSFILRELTVKDLDDFFTLFSTHLQSEFPEYSINTIHAMVSDPRMWSKENFRKILHNKTRLIIGAFIEEKIVGFIEAEYPFGGVSLGIWLIVHSDYQRRGVGKALLQKWEEIIKSLGGHNLYLYADKRNKQYYEKMGFKLIGLHAKGWFGQDEYIFSKIIAEPKEENYLK